MVIEVGGLARAACAVLAAAGLLFMANFGYGLVHEAAHAAVIDAMGGQVNGIYVNAFGPGAYTEHTAVSGAAGLVLVNAAGLCATSALALAFAAAGQPVLAAFVAARTAIYAINYAPGTDFATIHAVVGPASLGMSVIFAAVNIACIHAAISRWPAGAAINQRIIAGLSSSLWRARPAHSSQK